jgi:hypothetical protein
MEMGLEQACKAGDLARVRHLFATSLLMIAQDATHGLVAAIPGATVEVLRCVIENGACLSR